jgi:hypothetical protein
METKLSLLKTEAGNSNKQMNIPGFPEHIRKPRAPRKQKCIYCDTLIDPDKLIYTLDGRPVCENCYGDIDYDSTVVEISPDEVTRHQFNADFGDPDTGDMPVPIEKEKWVHTDGWRGYADWELLPGYIEWSDGWVTGYPDDTVSRKRTLADLYDSLKSRKIVPPVPIYWIFGRTSNVLSNSSSIVIAKSDVPTLEAWLPTVGLTKEDIDYMHS